MSWQGCHRGFALGLRARWNFPRVKLEMDSLPVVIQSVPVESTLNVSISTSLSSGVDCGLNVTKRTPSNRARPPLRVPTHKYPSGVWARQLTEFCGRPSSECQV